ncbi:hypothetical protein MICRO80W_300005 [Micrococcus luteus]|nr:hypothetical protein MICRO80W_300005 [Micrococcus luteus]
MRAALRPRSLPLKIRQSQQPYSLVTFRMVTFGYGN